MSAGEQDNIKRFLKLFTQFGTIEEPSRARSEYERLVRGTPTITRDLGGFLDHDDKEFRTLARGAMLKVGRRGDILAISEVCKRLDHEDAETRCGLLSLYASIVNHGDE